MTDSLPPDPYLALGVSRDATATAIKTQYRKLALKFHPDKVPDESQKAYASDQFHKIQTAYEIVSDDARRQRYDAQCRLEELRRDKLERAGAPRSGGDGRPPKPSSPPREPDYYSRGFERSGRVSPMYEERKPTYATQPEYTDTPPRATSRKEPEYERSTKRPSPRTEREKTKASAKDSKESERSSRREKSKWTDKDIRRDRDRKQPALVIGEDFSSDSDYDRARRGSRADERERRPREVPTESTRRTQYEQSNYYYPDDRARKMMEQEDGVRAQLERNRGPPRSRQNSDRRPSPVRMASSSKENVEFFRRSEGQPPVMVRHVSGRPRTSGREAEPRRSSVRDKDFDVVDEPQDMWRPPPLTSTKSSPAQIRIPTERSPFERQRAKSTQIDIDHDPIPQMRRAETMPMGEKGSQRDSRRKDNTVPLRSSTLRAEPKQAYPSPDTSPEPGSRNRRNYGSDDADHRTDIREPTVSFRQPRYARSPSPGLEHRSSRPSPAERSSRPSFARTTSTTYSYADNAPTRAPTSETYPRPSAPTRESSGRGMLFAEFSPTSPAAPPMASTSASRSPRMTSYNDGTAFGTPSYAREIRAEDINPRAGAEYSSRRRPSVTAATGKPGYYRSGSNPIHAQ